MVKITVITAIIIKGICTPAAPLALLASVRIRMETNLPVHVADEPLTAVVRGAGKVIDNLNHFSKVLIRNRRY